MRIKICHSCFSILFYVKQPSDAYNIAIHTHTNNIVYSSKFIAYNTLYTLPQIFTSPYLYCIICYFRRKSLFLFIIVVIWRDGNTIRGTFDFCIIHYYTNIVRRLYIIKSAGSGGHSHGSHLNKFYILASIMHVYTQQGHTSPKSHRISVCIGG